MKIWRIAAAVLVVAALGTACDSGVDNTEHRAALREVVSGAPEWVAPGPLGERLWTIEQQFYAARDFLPAWVDGVDTTPQWEALVQELRYSEAHGLDPDVYGVTDFERIRDESRSRWRGVRFEADGVPEMDAKMTYAYLRYAADLLGWTHSARDVDRNWLTEPKEDDLAERLTQALETMSVRQSLEQLAPAHSQYKGLQAALAREADAPTGRADAIRMNMERWRWAPRDFGDRHILVNVPAYTMQVVENGAPVLAMRVVVGEPEHQTPIFSDQMTYVVFSPYWNIPPGILRDETLPRAARDPDFLLRNNIEVLGTSGADDIDPWTIDWTDPEATKGLRFRQRPGADNALGLVKFMFPNRFNVYLHDTPADQLFARPERALSHGCVRVEDPVALARYVLRDQPEWTEEKIRGAMNARQEQTVKLKAPLPVHIGYWTAWVEPDGATVTFTDDPYEIDARYAAVRRDGAAATGE